MATNAQIDLKVNLNTQEAKATITQLKKELSTVKFCGNNGNNAGKSIDDLQKQTANFLNTIKNSEKAYNNAFKGVERGTENLLSKVRSLNAEMKGGKGTDEANKEYAKYEKTLKRLQTTYASLRAESVKLTKADSLVSVQIDSLRKRWANLGIAIKSVEKYYPKGTFEELKKTISDNSTLLQGLDKNAENFAETLKASDEALVNTTARFSEMKNSMESSHGSLLEIVGGFLKFQVAAMLVMKPLQLIRNAFQSINETLVNTEDRVIALKRVLNEDLGNGEISGEIYKLAERYGQTFDNVSDIAQNFARAGLSWNDTIKATESAVIALNVAELDASEASDGLLSIMNQFGYEAKDLTNIVDMLNKTADNFPVTTEKILTALQRTGSAAKNANLELEDTIGIVTAISKATNRSGENIGTAVNSLIQYSSKGTALDTFSNLGSGRTASGQEYDVTGAVENFKAGRGSILDIWKEVSIVIKEADERQQKILSNLAASEEVSDLSHTIQDELGDIFDTESKVYNTANTFRKNYFIALLDNIDTVDEAISTASESAGYSLKENETYMDSYTAKVNTLKASWQELANDEQGWLSFKKGLADMGVELVKVVDFMGGLKSVAIAAFLILNKIFAGQIYSALLKFRNTFSSLVLQFKEFGAKNIIGDIFKKPFTSLKDLTKATQDYKAAQDVLNRANINQAKRIRELDIANKELIEIQRLKNSVEQKENLTTEEAALLDQKETAAINNQAAAERNLIIASKEAEIAEKSLTTTSEAMGAAASSAAGIWGILIYAVYEGITLIANGIKKNNEAARQQRETAIETWRSNKEQGKSLEELVKQYKSLDKTNSDYKDIENQIIELLGDKIDVLQNLTKGTDDYRTALLKLSDAEIERYRRERGEAAVAAQGEVKNLKLGKGQQLSRNQLIVSNLDIPGNEDEKAIYEALETAGLGFRYADNTETGARYYLDGVSKKKDIRSQLESFKTLELAYNAIQERAKEAVTAGEFGLANEIRDNQFTKYIQGQLNNSRETISNFFETNTAQMINDYLFANDINSQDDFNKMVSEIKLRFEELGVDSNYFGETIENNINSFYKLDDALKLDIKQVENLNAKIEDLSDTAKNHLVESFKEIADSLKEADTWAEKLKSVEEARIALYDAQNQKNVRVFNAETGIWEWQANQKDIQQAQENYDKAILDLETSAYERINDLLESGNATNETIGRILAEVVPLLGGDSNFADTIKGKLAAEGVTDFSGLGTYDKGGILTGKGGIKAVSEPEMVLPPDVTANFMKGATMANFNDFVKNMGIMVGGANEVAKAQPIYNNGGNTYNNGNNSYVVNGVPISQEMASTHTLAEIFDDMDLVGN